MPIQIGTEIMFDQSTQYDLHSINSVSHSSSWDVFSIQGLVASAGGAMGHASPSTDVIDAHLAVQGTIRWKYRLIELIEFTT